MSIYLSGKRASLAFCTLALASLATIPTSSVFAKALIEQSLENWANSTEHQSLMMDESDSTKNIIVTFKSQAFQDRTGLSRSEAILKEKAYGKSFLRKQMAALQKRLSAVAHRFETLWSSNAAVLKINRHDLNVLAFHPYVDSIVEDQVISLSEPFISDPSPVSNFDQSKTTYVFK